MIVGIPFAYYRRAAFEGVFLVYVVNMFFFVLLVSQVTSLQKLKSLVWVICLCTVMYSVFGGLLQAEYGGGGRLYLAGHMFDPNDTAYVLLSLFPLCLYFVRFDAGLLKRLVAVAAICGAVATILLTGSRGGILGFGAVLLILLLTKAGGIGKSYKWLVVVMLFSTLLFVKDTIDVERYLTLTDISSDYNLSERGGRIDLWKGAVALSLTNPLTGVGVDSFTYAHFLARAAAGESFLRYTAIHNSYLQISTETGLIGFGVFMFIIVRSFSTFLRMSRMQVQPETRETGEMRALGGFMLLGFAGHLVSGFFLSQGYSIFFTLYFGLAAAVGRLQGSSSVWYSSSEEASSSYAKADRNARLTEVDVRDSETRIRNGGKGTGGRARHGRGRESGG
jgi:O-antigen ligase